MTDPISESEQLPAPLSKMDVLLGLRISVWEGALATIWTALTTGAFLTGFALYLGANNFAISLLTAIPTFSGLVQLISSYSGERRKTRKPLAGGSALVGRLMWIPILLLPVALKSGAIYAFLALFTASYILLNFSVPAWTSWMSDLVPADYRGRYFARRNMIAGIVGMVVSLPAASFLDYTTKKHHWPNLGFGVLFAAAAAAALGAFACITRQPEPPKSSPQPEDADRGAQAAFVYFRAPFKDRNFLRLMSFNALFGAGQFFAMPFFTVYAIESLKLNYVSLQVFAAITSISGLASMPLWGYLLDKFGGKPLLAICICGVFTIPFSWMLTTPDHHVTTMLLLIEINVAAGMFWAGVGLTQFNLLIGFSPPGKTSIYVGTMSAVVGLSAGLAPMMAGVVMNALHNWHSVAIGLHLSNYHITFLLAALLRICALPLLRTVVDDRSVETKDVLKQLGSSNPRSWRHIRKLQRGDQDARLKATGALAGSRTQLAGDELRAALMDPSRAVREEAARALGEIGDPTAVDALIASLSDPASGLLESASIALARIGDRKANAPLAALLNSPAGAIARRNRIFIAGALGVLGGADAVTALLQALRSSEDEELTEALVAALGRTGSSRATQTLIELSDRPDTNYSLQQTLVKSLGEIGDPGATETLRALIVKYADDEGMAPITADSLARLASGDVTIELLHSLLRLDSPLARKQVAHAIGTLLGEGDLAYSLLSQDEMERDASIKRLLLEVQRVVAGTPAERSVRLAAKAHSEGNTELTVKALNRALKSAVPDGSFSEQPAHRVQCRRYADALAQQSSQSISLEALLTGFCALGTIRHEGPRDRAST